MNKYGFIYEQLNNVLKIPYEYWEWTSSEIPGRYWVGECTEIPTNQEDGYRESTMLLTGTVRGKAIVLETDKEAIEAHFPVEGGLCASLDGGAIAVFFAGATPIPTGEADLKRLQINLDIKEWKGMKKYGTC